MMRGMTSGNDDSLDHVGHHRGRRRPVVRRSPWMLKLSSRRGLVDERGLLRVYCLNGFLAFGGVDERMKEKE